MKIKKAKRCRVFVSYSNDDEALGESKSCPNSGYPGAFYKRLQVSLRGLVDESEIFFSLGGLAGEENWPDAICQALDECDFFILLVSPNSLGSKYCMDKELARVCALKRAKIITVYLKQTAASTNSQKIYDPNSGAYLCTLGELCGGGLPRARGRLKPVSKWREEEDAWTSVCDEIASLVKSSSPQERHSATSQIADADRAIESGTELQSMLAAHLNKSWRQLIVLPEFYRLSVFSDFQKPFTARSAMSACVSSEPNLFLSRLGWILNNDDIDMGSSLRLLRENEVFRETIKLMTLVVGERFVLKGAHGVKLEKTDPFDGEDQRVVAVLAAACLGFGLLFSPGEGEPANFVNLPAEELCYEQGKGLVKKTLLAMAKRRLHSKAYELQYNRPSRTSNDFVIYDETVKASLQSLKEAKKIRLVIVAPDGSAMRNPELANTVLQEFGVPTMWRGVPRVEVGQLIDNLAVLIAPLLEGTLAIVRREH